jgi:hypothetical protein
MRDLTLLKEPLRPLWRRTRNTAPWPVESSEALERAGDILDVASGPSAPLFHHVVFICAGVGAGAPAPPGGPVCVPWRFSQGLWRNEKAAGRLVATAAWERKSACIVHRHRKRTGLMKNRCIGICPAAPWVRPVMTARSMRFRVYHGSEFGTWGPAHENAPPASHVDGTFRRPERRLSQPQ